LIKLAQTTKIIKPKILEDASTTYLKSKALFEKNRNPKDYQKQIEAYNKLAQLVVTKKITAPPEIANTQAEYFQAKKRYTESLKNKSVTTGKMPNVSNKKEIYKKYIEVYKKLLKTMHGDIKGNRETPEQKAAYKEFLYWRNKYAEAIKTKR